MNKILNPNGPRCNLRDIYPFLSVLHSLDLKGPGTTGISMKFVTWMEWVICSNNDVETRYYSAELVMQLLEKLGGLPVAPGLHDPYVPTLLRFLELCEDFHRSNSIPTLKPEVPSDPEPEISALRILRLRYYRHFSVLTPTMVSVLTRVLRPDDRLQSRVLGLGLFARLWLCWPSLSMCDGITPEMCSRLVGVIGDPLRLSEPQPSIPTFERSHIGRDADQVDAVGILLGLTLSDTWRGHFRPANFASCSLIMSREDLRRPALATISRLAKTVTGSADAKEKSAMLIRSVERLKGLTKCGAVELMLLHVWSSDEMYSFDEESWEWLKRETLELFNTRGTEYLPAFATYIGSRHYSDAAVAFPVLTLKRKDGVQRRIRIRDSAWVLGMLVEERTPSYPAMWEERTRGLLAVCRVRGLFQVVGWDPAWKEGVLPVVDSDVVHG